MEAADQVPQCVNGTLKETMDWYIGSILMHHPVWCAYLTAANSDLRKQNEIMVKNDRRFNEIRNQSLFGRGALFNMASSAFEHET